MYFDNLPYPMIHCNYLKAIMQTLNKSNRHQVYLQQILNHNKNGIRKRTVPCHTFIFGIIGLCAL